MCEKREEQGDFAKLHTELALTVYNILYYCPGPRLRSVDNTSGRVSFLKIVNNG